ncbi:MAG: porin [Proteobacteria bacterium]|uniref:porin n=1 Tax=Aquabacterium sp. TaxID=1872578 RepID=UPI0035C6940D|nr:porin [Pseudomonadota bacterium]
MKKTVLALAAIAASSAAFAQSSVTLYGVVDASFESIKSDKTYTRVSSDNLATSRIGFKGTEDLGGGLKANFRLESNVKVDTGANGNSRFFDRAAWVGVSSADAGELRIGRQDSLIGGLVDATIGALGYDESVTAQTLSGVAYRRLDNALTYSAPAFVPGLSLSAQYSTAANPSGGPATNAEANAGSKQGRAFGFLANYVQGPIGAGLAYISANATADGKTDQTGLYVYGSYDFGLAKLTAYTEQDKQDGAFDKRKVYGAKVAVPVVTNFVVTAGYAAVKGANATSYNFNAANTAKDSAKVATLKAAYSLSKRTTVYGLFTEVWNDDNARLKVTNDSALASPALGKGSRGVAVGVSHAF